MSDIELVITWSRRLEKLLASRYGAKGRGLHALTTSARRRLPADAEPGLRWVATLRNKVVHDEAFRLKSRRRFALEASRIERMLVSKSGSLLPRPSQLVALALFTAGIWVLTRLLT